MVPPLGGEREMAGAHPGDAREMRGRCAGDAREMRAFGMKSASPSLSSQIRGDASAIFGCVVPTASSKTLIIATFWRT